MPPPVRGRSNLARLATCPHLDARGPVASVGGVPRYRCTGGGCSTCPSSHTALRTSCWPYTRCGHGGSDEHGRPRERCSPRVEGRESPRAVSRLPMASGGEGDASSFRGKRGRHSVASRTHVIPLAVGHTAAGTPSLASCAHRRSKSITTARKLPSLPTGPASPCSTRTPAMRLSTPLLTSARRVGGVGWLERRGMLA